jgi:hypothetical protein
MPAKRPVYGYSYVLRRFFYSYSTKENVLQVVISLKNYHFMGDMSIFDVF